MRIVTLLPSATDIVVALGGGDDLVGVSHSCGPAWSHLPALTSTRLDLTASSANIDAEVKAAASPLYDLDIEQLEHLAPDVVVSQSLCDVCAVASGDVEAAVRGLSSQPALVNLMPFGLSDITDGFRDVGMATKRQVQANELTALWRRQLSRFKDRFSQPNPISLGFLDWLDPPFAAGHWIPEIIELLGCHSAFAQPGEPSHEIDWDTVRRADADITIAACCGFSTERAARDLMPDDVSIQILDGDEHFSRPSPRLLDSIELLVDLLDKSIGALSATQKA